MKHTTGIVIAILLLFFLSQVAGLFIVYKYVDTEKTLETGKLEWKQLPYGQERPKVEPNFSYVPIAIAIAVGTVLALLLVRFGWFVVWRLWFFLAVWYCVAISLAAFINSIVALVAALLLALFKLYGRNVIIKNLTEIFIYAGIAAILVPVLNILAASVLLVLISIYDAWAVWKSGHMIVLAKAQSKLKVFAGLQIPYTISERVKTHEKVSRAAEKPQKTKIKTTMKTAILGGGDIAFSLLFAGAVMKDFGFYAALIIPIFTTLALCALLIFGQKNKFYPAMPFLTAGCFLGYVLILIL